MGNAAQISDRKKVHLEFTDGRTLSSECGNFSYQAAAGPDGPLIVHLLKLADRNDKANEPIAIFSRVASFRLDEVAAPMHPGESGEPDEPGEQGTSKEA